MENLPDVLRELESYRQWNILLKGLLGLAGVTIVVLLILWRLSKGKWIRFQREAEGGRRLLEDYKADAEQAMQGERENFQSTTAKLLGKILEQEYKVATIHYDGFSLDESDWVLTLFFRVQPKMREIALSHDRALRESCELLSRDYAILPTIRYEIRGGLET